MPTTEHFDAIVIGSGQAGGPLAADLARAGRKTALVERERLGGSCVNWGCTPTKTMVASARVAWLARRAADYGVRVGRVAVDLARVRQRKRDVVELFGGVPPDRAPRLRGRTVLYGEARFLGPHRIEVAMHERAGHGEHGRRGKHEHRGARGHGGEVRELTGDLIFINTGARPSRPAIPGLEEVGALDSTSIMELDRVPDRLLVLGGGYIGLEFGQMFRRFGSRVTIVQRGDALLSREDPDVAEAVASILREDGIEVLLGTDVEGIRRTSRGGSGQHGRRGANGGRGQRDSRVAPIELMVRARSSKQGSRARARTLTGSHLLVATGRVPNTDRLHLAAAGVAVDERGQVVVNERLETSAPGVYALGDVKGGPAFTHISYDDYRILRTNLLEGGNATTRGRLVPYAVFMDPELGRVGLSETEARTRGLGVRVHRMGMDSVARALERDEPRGFMKIVVDAATDQILGCAILGIDGGELMSMVEIAMLGKVPSRVLREAIFAHPTLAESLNNVFEESTG